MHRAAAQTVRDASQHVALDNPRVRVCRTNAGTLAGVDQRGSALGLLIRGGSSVIQAK